MLPIVNFFCRFCRRDLELPAQKESNRYGEWFSAQCPDCGEKLIRYLTEIKNDPYYKLSPRVQKDRWLHRKDIVQPDDPEFKLFYPKQWQKMESLREKATANKKYA